MAGASKAVHATLAKLSRAYDTFEAQQRQRSSSSQAPLSPYLTAQPILAFLVSIEPLLTKLTQLQLSHPSPPTPTHDPLPRLTEWLLTHAPTCGVTRTWAFHPGSGGRGNSVVALTSLPPSSPIMSIPHHVVVTVRGFIEGTAYASAPAAAWVRWLEELKDPLLSNLPSLMLSLLLLYERQRGATSPLSPYLDALPTEFTLPLFIPATQLHLLQHSPALLSVCNVQYNAIKQFVYLHTLLTQHRLLTPSPPSLPFLTSLPTPFTFTLPSFLWSLAVVMTRQNRIPSPSSHTFYDLALIPGWDFCNHRGDIGSILTSFDPVTGESEMRGDGVRGVGVGEEVEIYYGDRGTREMWVYSGFVDTGNRHAEYEMTVQGGRGGEGEGAWVKIKEVMRRKAGVDKAYTVILPLPYTEEEWVERVKECRRQDSEREETAQRAWEAYTAKGGTITPPSPLPSPPTTVPTAEAAESNRTRLAVLLSWCRIEGVRTKEEAMEAVRVQALGKDVGRVGVEVERRGLEVLLGELEREEAAYEGGLERGEREVKELEREAAAAEGMDRERQLAMVQMRCEGLRMLQAAQQRVKHWMAALDADR